LESFGLELFVVYVTTEVDLDFFCPCHPTLGPNPKWNFLFL